MNKKIHKLIDESYDSYSMFVIVSTDSNLKLSWNLNQILNINIASIPDISITFQNDNTVCFSCFSDANDDEETALYLISNKSEGYFFLDEFKNVDYLLVMKNYSEDQIKTDYNICKSIISIMPIDLNKIKSKERIKLIKDL